MHILAKRGEADNIATYQHFCDTVADMSDISPNEINLGSVCIVLEGTNGGLEVYIANSKKQWKLFSASGENEGN